jgi:hypothetical protein
VLVDLGKTINQLGSERIITPDKYKRIDNCGTIVATGPKCRLFNQSHIGKKVLVETYHRDDSRLNPTVSEKYGLKPHWHFLLPEDKLELIIE